MSEFGNCSTGRGRRPITAIRCSTIFGQRNRRRPDSCAREAPRGRYLPLAELEAVADNLFSVVKGLDHERHRGFLHEAMEASTAIGVRVPGDALKIVATGEKEDPPPDSFAPAPDTVQAGRTGVPL